MVSLSVGAEIGEPLMVAAWGDAVGTLTDAYGVPWRVNLLVAVVASD